MAAKPLSQSAVTGIWDDVLTDTDRKVIANAGYGKPRGLGASPLMMVIDCQYNYIGADEPVDEQQDRWPAGGGAGAWRAVRNISRLLDASRASDVPVLYTRNVQKRTTRFDSFAAKSTWDKRATLDESEGSRIVDELAPHETDLVLDKSYASAFYGTPLVNYLVGLRADTLVISGVSTGGCVRATAVDAVSRGFSVAVVADAVADRIVASHKVALLDMWMKYADVVDTASALDYLASAR
ncbi:MAG TPA: isochorismatase family protein [Acidimicrobiia bacterium]|jgi:nicotinamidase-related amidase|nr:isochorismatase family protein [Acidimicrobiia bacterium]